MRWIAGLLLAAMPVAAWAEDARLSELQGVLVPMRKIPAAHLRLRGATPALTTIKHKLRDWMETHLSALEPNGDAEALARQLNDELSFSARMFRRAAKHSARIGRCLASVTSLLDFTP